MMNMMRKIIFGVLGTLLLALPLVPAMVQAAPLPGYPAAQFADFKSDACNGVGQLGNGGCGTGSGNQLSNDLKTVVELLSIVAGVAAVIMVIISGIKFITAQGDPSGISSARSSLLYALVGLVIVAAAQAIVHFVLGKA